MTRTRVASRAELEPGRVTYVEAEGRPLAICPVGANVYAIDDVCTHDGGSLDQGYLDGNLVECPRHGARFDVITGRAVTLPAVRPVRTYPVTVEGDDVWVDVE
jgi:3-phenylpropionate/trans-cinnamate dioxygenase ferredoxin subunit